MMGNWGYGYGMMGNWGGWGAFGFFALAFWVVSFVDLVLLGLWLWRQLQRK